MPTVSTLFSLFLCPGALISGVHDDITSPVLFLFFCTTCSSLPSTRTEASLMLCSELHSRFEYSSFAAKLCITKRQGQKKQKKTTTHAVCKLFSMSLVSFYYSLISTDGVLSRCKTSFQQRPVQKFRIRTH